MMSTDEICRAESLAAWHHQNAAESADAFADHFEEIERLYETLLDVDGATVISSHEASLLLIPLGLLFSRIQETQFTNLARDAHAAMN